MWSRIQDFSYYYNHTLCRRFFLTLTHRYLVNVVRGHKTGSNTLEWKITSGGKKTRVCMFSPSNLLSSPFFSLPPSRNSDPGSHNRLFPPLPATVRALHFYRENISVSSSLVDSRRIVLYSRYTLSAVDPSHIFLEINSKSHHGGIRTPGPTLFDGYYH